VEGRGEEELNVERSTFNVQRRIKRRNRRNAEKMNVEHQKKIRKYSTAWGKTPPYKAGRTGGNSQEQGAHEPATGWDAVG
jgi:hypothetical protein